jgi:hypothetical protein
MFRLRQWSLWFSPYRLCSLLSGGELMFLRLMSIAACLFGCGCASTQLNYNTADLASSLNSLTKRQIFFNLAQALTDPEFVPSQATISIGTAQTLNAITPSVSVPLGLPMITTARDGTGRFAGTQFSTQVTTPTPTLGVQMTDGWNQSWTMVPVNSSPQLRRLRALYQYATGTMPRPDKTRELTAEEAERQFMCDYPVQAFNVSPTGNNVIFRIDGCVNNTTRESQSRIVHADPTFTQGSSCVICIDDLNAKQLRPHVNPNLKYHFIRTQKSGDMVSIGSYGQTGFYVCGSAEGDCLRAASQDPFDGRKAFSDFILFVYEAATAPSQTGAGRQTGGSFVYSVR